MDAAYAAGALPEDEIDAGYQEVVEAFRRAGDSVRAGGAMVRRAFALQVKLCARPAFRPLYTNYDTWFAPKLVGDDAYTEAPEQYAARLKARW